MFCWRPKPLCILITPECNDTTPLSIIVYYSFQLNSNKNGSPAFHLMALLHFSPSFLSETKQKVTKTLMLYIPSYIWHSVIYICFVKKFFYALQITYRELSCIIHSKQTNKNALFLKIGKKYDLQKKNPAFYFLSFRGRKLGLFATIYVSI